METFNIIQINPYLLRANLLTENDIISYMKYYSQQTQTSWCVLKTFKSNRYVIRKIYVCHHSGVNKVDKALNRKGKSKNCGCESKIDIKIKLTNSNTKKKDSYVKDGLPAIVKFENEHNHSICTAEALSFLRPTTDDNVRNQFEEYFNNGLGISESSSMHESKIELEYGPNCEQLANASINPKYRTVRFWYDRWKQIHLGPASGVGVIQVHKDDRKTLYLLFRAISEASTHELAMDSFNSAIGLISTSSNVINGNNIPLKYPKWILYVSKYWDRKEIWYQLKKASNINKEDIEELSDNIFKIKSENQNVYYEIDGSVGFCTCPKGKMGGFCKHQAAVYHHFGQAMPNLPPISVDARYSLAKLAFGQNVGPKSFYMPLFPELSNNHSLNQDINKESTIQSSENPVNSNDIHLANETQNEEIDEYENQIISLMTDNFKKYNRETSSAVLQKCIDRLKKVKSSRTWESFLSTAGSNITLRHRTRATIRVQPTTLSRRKPGITRGSKRLPVGRPLNSDKHKKFKRKRNLGVNVRLNVPNAKSHN
ncbi:hypothetical protein ACI65C_006897 [Semiaphis heraclei]